MDGPVTQNPVVQAIEEAGVVAVIRMRDAAPLHAVVSAISDGGVRALEVTMTVPGAVDLIRELSSALPAGFLLGAGTVLDAETAGRVIKAGAQFVVSPVFRTSVIDACHSKGVAVMPGCFTPTEILSAWEAGADIVKVFPATALGPGASWASSAASFDRATCRSGPTALGSMRSRSASSWVS